MTKTQIKKELDGQTVGGRFWNSVATIENIKVARVCWHRNQYKVIPMEATFEDVKERTYKPIEAFFYQQELIDYIYGKVNNL